jgi:hypothetical protein
MKRFTDNHTRLAISERTWRTIRGVILATIAMLAVTLSATISYADCGPMAGMKFPIIKLPVVATTGIAAAEGMPNSQSRDSIVGLWHTMYTAGNAPFAETLKQWQATAPSSKTSITIPQLEPSV